MTHCRSEGGSGINQENSKRGLLGSGTDEATKKPQTVLLDFVKWEKRKGSRKPDGNGVSYGILPAQRSGFARCEMESCSLSSHTVLGRQVARETDFKG